MIESPSAVLAAFPGLRGAVADPVEVGNINRTFLVTAGAERWILQELNPIFVPEIHLDIEAVTAHLAAKGVETPRLLRTTTGDLWTVDTDGGVWRVLTHIEGVNHSRMTSTDLAESAGNLLGRFHSALFDLDHTFAAGRLGVHDTARHLAHLEEVLNGFPEHPGRGKAEQLAAGILAAARALPRLEGLPPRIVHGDPKLDNIIFTRGAEPICFIDLDTVGRLTIPVELGDALRSWCNTAGESSVAAHFDLRLLEAALGGYATHAAEHLTAVEVTSIPVAIETITLELAARFCADILEETYFAWDYHTYDAAWQHHAVRAEGQLRLAWAYGAVRKRAAEIVSSVLRG